MVSIIVPVYNAEDTINRTIESLIKQTVTNYEIILVDDGSTDRCPYILDEYEKKYNNVIVLHQNNSGVTVARLNGVRIAHGEWIGFVDADDIVLSDMYKRLLQNAEEYNALISHCGFQMVFGDGRRKFFYNTGKIVLQDNKEGLKDLIEGSYIEPGLWNKLFHKTLFNKLLNNNIMDVSIKNNEDLLMNYYLFKESHLSIYEDFCPYMYIIRDLSASRGLLDTNRIMDPIKVKKIIVSDTSIKKELLPIALRAYINTCINSYNTIAGNLLWRKCSSEIRKILYNYRSNFRLLTKNKKISAWLILVCPSGYAILIRFYGKYIRKSKYN